jgi:hypothetical protein
MHKKATWVLAAASAGLYFACGSQPDWTDVQDELAARKAAAQGAGGSDMTGGQTTGSSGTDTSNPTTGSGGSAAMTTGGGSVTPGTGGTNMGGAGTAVSTQDSGASSSDAGGMMDQRSQDLIELADALKSLNGFIYENACKIDCSGKDVTTLTGCNTADICWATPGCGRFFESRTINIGGPPGHTYEVDLNILGVTEPRDYPPAPNCAFEPGQPQTTTSVAKCMDGFANSASVTFNVYEFAIASPPAKYYLNAVATHPPHRVDKTDNKWTITVASQSTIKFTMDDLNGGEIRNCTNVNTTSQYKTAAKSPFGDALPIKANANISQPYNGNWFQLSVMDARVK